MASQNQNQSIKCGLFTQIKSLLNLSSLGPLIHLKSKMKAFAVVLLSCLAVASAQIDCDTCTAAVEKLGTFLVTPDEIAKEVLLLKTFVCEPDSDPQGCADGVDKYWEGMAKAIFSYEDTPADICSAGGICKKGARALDCETCAGNYFHFRKRN